MTTVVECPELAEYGIKELRNGLTLEILKEKHSWILVAKIENAILGLKDDTIIWYNGTWEFGIWESGIWKNGWWEDGIWKDGTWEKGKWENGWWEDGTWKDGIWKNGTWKNGTWITGKWIVEVQQHPVNYKLQPMELDKERAK